MTARLHALIADTHLKDASIYIFRQREDAERAARECRMPNPEIVTFTCGDLWGGAVNGLLYLALSLEDTGLRVRASFRSMFGLNTFLSEHVGESNCFPAMGWVEPVLQNGRLYERIRLPHQQSLVA
jgi:hypothetical protein